MARCLAKSTLGSPSDTYFYALARSGNTLATIGSDDCLRLFDGALKPMYKAASAHSGITCLSTIANGFATAGRDGSVRCWDQRAKDSNIKINEPKGNGLSAIACHDHVIAAGTESVKEGLGDVSVLLYDTRKPSAPVRSYVESQVNTSVKQLLSPALRLTIHAVSSSKWSIMCHWVDV